MKITSDYALIDVTIGAKELEKHFENKPVSGPCPEEFLIPVTLTGYISNVFGNHDGTSQQFEMTVANIETSKEE